MIRFTTSLINLFTLLSLFALAGFAQATEGSSKGKILMVASSPATALNGWSVGAWIAEISHPYDELTHAGYDVEIVSTNGGKIEIDTYSDPRHESGYSAKDIVSLGFLLSPLTSKKLENTPSISDVNPNNYQAIVLAGGLAPMFTYRENKKLQDLIMNFYDSGKPTALLCHGVAALVDIKLPNGKYFVEGKRVTGFSLYEDKEVEKATNSKMFDWYVEEALTKRGAKYMENGPGADFAIQDGNLITGQQQYSGRSAARLVLQQLSN
ncbi:MAG: type 1 glutamine amidotransferase domain-containing protein [Acidobacteriota bacterium]|nr:type 1 glutamine amidotransferase domain-containing protein [Acidobacteriota bacterium]